MNDPRWQVDYLTEKLAERSEYIKGKHSQSNLRQALWWAGLVVLLLIIITIIEIALR